MKCSVGMIYNNERDLDRFVSVVDEGDSSQTVRDGRSNGDAQLWEDSLRIGDLIEPLGFDAVFAYEHHFTPYVQIPSPMQFLAFWAGRTERIGVGSMLVILPWHNPIRLVEELIQLQYMLADRDMTMGLGRGLGIREYSGLGLPMGESRQRFDEGVEVIKMAIMNESFEYEGETFRFPDGQREGAMSIRPQPKDRHRLMDSLYGGWASPTSYKQIAREGLHAIVIPNRAYNAYTNELAEFVAIQAEMGLPPTSACVTSSFTFCAESQNEKEEIRSYIDRVKVRSGDVNYEHSKSYHAGIPGYEFYGQRKRGVDSAPDDHQVGLAQDWTLTPDEMIDYIQELYDMYDSCSVDQFVFTFMRMSLPVERAEKSMRLFAKEVMPFVHELKPRHR